MTKRTKLFLSILLGAAAVSAISVPFFVTSCSKDKDTTKDTTKDGKQTSAPVATPSQTQGSAELIQTQGAADQMGKLADGQTLTLAADWGDSRVLVKDSAARAQLVVVGATDVIANDGIVATNQLKQGDIDAVQDLFISLINKANQQKSDFKNAKKANASLTFASYTGSKDLLIDEKEKDGTEKVKTLFEVYDHNGYSKVSPTAEISFINNGQQTQKTAFGGQTPADGSDYFELNNGVVSAKQGSPKFIANFIGSTDTTYVGQAKDTLQAYLNAHNLANMEITVASSYDAAANGIKNGSVQLAFLPLGTWSETETGLFILEAGRPVQVADPYAVKNGVIDPSTPAVNDEKALVDAMNNYQTYDSANAGSLYLASDTAKRPTQAGNGLDQSILDAIKAIPAAEKGKSLPVVGYYRSYVFAKKGSKIYDLITEAMKNQGSNWKLNWNDVKQFIKYGYNSKTSNSSYIYAEQWFAKHFTGFTSFNDIILGQN